MSDIPFLHELLNVTVVDYWTGEPLQGVPVKVGVTEEQATGKFGSNSGGMTDQNGLLSIECPVGPVFVFIAPALIQETWVGNVEPAEMSFACHDLVKLIRHGFDL